MGKGYHRLRDEASRPGMPGWGSRRDHHTMLHERGSLEPQLTLTLRLFVEQTQRALENRLLSVVLHGSVLFDDLAPGYGDLDFVAVVDEDLTEEDRSRLVAFRVPFRRGEHGVLAAMLEGPFLPRKMLDPARPGSALCWGTGGDRVWECNKLGWFVLHLIRERGLVVWGEDIRREIPVVTRQHLMDDVRSACEQAQQHGRGGGLHSIDWLLTAARSLLWLKEGKVSSKSEAADWGSVHAQGAWRDALPRCKALRLNPHRADTGEVKRWLDTLTPLIIEAWNEVGEKIGS